MCGLVAIITHQNNGFSYDQKNAVYSQMYINALRGSDSTGAVLVTKDKEETYCKAVGGPAELWNTKPFVEMEKDLYSKGKIFFSHGRAATKGTVSVENAHPFSVSREDGSRILLVHNGTLHQFQQLDGLNDHDVDSAWMADCIAKLGWEETLSKINGPIATIWWDTSTEKLNIFRNHERPLYTVTDAGGSVYINSEKAGLIWLRHRHDLKYTDDDIKFFEAGHLYTMDPEVGIAYQEKIQVNRVLPPVRSYHGGYGEQNPLFDSLADYYTETRDNWRNQRAGRQRLNNSTMGHTWPKFSSAWWKQQPRNLQLDYLWMKAGEITEVRWCYGSRKTTFKDGGQEWVGYIGESDKTPYILHLDYMDMSEDKETMRLHFSEGNHGEVPRTWVETYEPPKSSTKTVGPNEPTTTAIVVVGEGAVPGEPHPDYPKVLPFPKGKNLHSWLKGVTFSPNATAKWKFKDVAHNRVIKHKGSTTPQYATHFITYQNNADGAFRLGEEICLEVYQSTERANNILECRGNSVKPNGADVAVDFHFYMKDRTKIEVDNLRFVKGKICQIRVATDLEHKENGAQVVIQINNPKLIDQNVSALTH